MSDQPPTAPSAPAAPPARLLPQLVRLPIDKPQPAVAFLHARSRGVMDLIAHFWERLAHTPPLQRADLHLVVAAPQEENDLHINIIDFDAGRFTGAMLYVPKAHRADVLALDLPTAAAFAAYISHQGPKAVGTDPSAPSRPAEITEGAEIALTLPLRDLSTAPKNGAAALEEMPAEPPAPTTPKSASPNGRLPIDFLTGDAVGIAYMTQLLLPLVHKRAPARQLVNVVMQLPPDVPAELDPHVRLAKVGDIPTLNRWRRLYKEERGILFDADMDALVANQSVYVYERDQQLLAVAKIDLELASLVEIGGVYTFAEFRQQGFGGTLVRDLAARIRLLGKTPTLQVDAENTPAVALYEKAGWKPLGKLARVWLTG